MHQRPLRVYHETMRQHADGADVSLTPGQALRKLMKDQSISAELLASQLGYATGVLHKQLDSRGFNENMIAKLAHMTDMDAAFWRRTEFKPDELTDVGILLYRDASHIAETKGGSHSKRLRDQTPQSRGAAL